MNLFGVGPTEIFVVVIVILVLFGPDKLPEIAKKIGGVSREIREGLDTINEQMNSALEASMEMDRAQMSKPPSEAPAPTDNQTSALASEPPAPADSPVIMPPSDNISAAASTPQDTTNDTTRPEDTTGPSQP